MRGAVGGHRRVDLIDVDPREEPMKGKLAVLAGAAAGYVLGTRAGRERYEQIKDGAQRLWQDPRVKQKRQQAAHVARDQGVAAAHAAKDKVQEKVQDRAHGGAHDGAHDGAHGGGTGGAATDSVSANDLPPAPSWPA